MINKYKFIRSNALNNKKINFKINLYIFSYSISKANGVNMAKDEDDWEEDDEEDEEEEWDEEDEEEDIEDEDEE